MCLLAASSYAQVLALLIEQGCQLDNKSFVLRSTVHCTVCGTCTHAPRLCTDLRTRAPGMPDRPNRPSAITGVKSFSWRKGFLNAFWQQVGQWLAGHGTSSEDSTFKWL